MTEIDDANPQIPMAPHSAEAQVTTVSYYRGRNTGELAVITLASVLLRHWRAVLGFPVGLSLLALIVVLLVPPTYTAATAFVPEEDQSRDLSGALALLGSQVGLPASILGGSRSPTFYAEVLKSRELMDRILVTSYPDPREGATASDSATLLEVLDAGGDSFADSLQEAREELEDLMEVRVQRQTDIVYLRVDSRHPTLAAAVTNQFVQYLNEFNAQSRQSQAGERRKFIGARIGEAERDLRSAEAELEAFYERNRRWQQSPELVFAEGRLRRKVDGRQEVYWTLSREYETARIEEVNDTPVITVIDAATPPPKRSKPKRTITVILAFTVGTLGGLAWAFGAHFTDRMRHVEEEEFETLVGLAKGVPGELRHALRSVIGRKRQ